MATSHVRWTGVRRWAIPLAYVLVGAVVGGGAIALTNREPAQAADSVADAAAAQQQVATVGLETLEQSVSTTGTLTAVTSESLAFAASGQVIAVNVEVGDPVSEGDVLAQIDDLQLDAALKGQEAELASAEASLADLEEEADGTDSSDSKIAAAEATVTVRQQAVEDAEDAMADADLVATMAGVVTTQSYAVGDAVSSGGSTGGADAAGSGTTTAAAGIQIVGQDAWTVDVSLGESDVALISEGDQVTFTADDVDTMFGIVTDISLLPSTTGGTAAYPVTLQVTGTPTGLFEGVSVTADITYQRRVDVLAVSTNAITTTDDVSTVTIVGDDDAEEVRTVTVGETVGNLTEITDGLVEGEQVVVVRTVTGATDAEGTGQDAGEFAPGGGDLQVPDGVEFPAGERPGR
ncbi:efflux RND transporter periplasmic adaptor subunit [Demequina aurantiaca]|uniref:efflux RND transporter periplasmic adaptor subunit n=1 Tax=Demequina aurantiaca TaxID=676200 RepID=UPI003D34420A